MKERLINYIDEWKWFFINQNPFERILIGLLGLMVGLFLLVVY